MTLRACTIKVTNKGPKEITTKFRGTHQVTMLETRITDNETGEVLNVVESHSAAKDTITISAFYDKKDAPP